MNAPLPTLPAAADSAGALSGLSVNPNGKQIDSSAPGGFGAALQEAQTTHTGDAEALPGEAHSAHSLARTLEALPHGGKLLPLVRQLLDAAEAGGADRRQVLEQIAAKLERIDPASDLDPTEAALSALSALIETYAAPAVGSATAEQATALQPLRSAANNAQAPLARWLPEALAKEAGGLETDSRAAAGAERLSLQLQTPAEQRPAELVSAIMTELKRMAPNAQREAGDSTFRAEPSVTLTAQASKSVSTGSGSGVPTLDLELPLKQAGWDRAFGEKIEWMVTQRLQGAQIRLNPAHLGPMEVRVQMQNEQASIQFTSAHAVVRDVLEAALPRLREMLDASGVELVDVDISGQSFAEQQSAEQGRETNFGSFAAAGEGDAQAPILETPVASMLDKGLLDLFA